MIKRSNEDNIKRVRQGIAHRLRNGTAALQRSDLSPTEDLAVRERLDRWREVLSLIDAGECKIAMSLARELMQRPVSLRPSQHLAEADSSSENSKPC